EVELTAVELDAGLGQHRLGDVGGGDRAEELALATGLRRDGDHGGHQLAGDVLGGGAGCRILDVARATHRLGLGLGTLGGDEREPLRQEEVAGVAVGDVADVALVADAVDIGAQNDLHSSPPSVVSSVSIVSSTEVSASSSPLVPGGGAVGRGGGPSARPPRSPRSERWPRWVVTRLV